MIWMKKWIIVPIAALATLMSCNESIDKKLVWSDEFEYAGTPDSTKWGYNLGDGCPNCGWGNSELEYYTKDINIEGDSASVATSETFSHSIFSSINHIHYFIKAYSG